MVNCVLVSNAAHLTAAAPHRAVLSLSTGDRDDLLAYLRQQDARDANGNVLPAPVAPHSFEEAPELIAFTSPTTLTLTAPSLENSPGQSVLLESSADLDLWTPIPAAPTILLPVGTEWRRLEFTIPPAADARRFYRARLSGP